MLPSLASALAILPTLALAATADQWRSRSIYQIITDRFALPKDSNISPNACDPMKQTWCGGTWNSIRERLDYVQDMGFSAIWISPVNHNIAGDTVYGDPYHGYWIDDITQLNPKFGTPDDLKALSAELHRRGMYLMVDMVVNNVVATTTTPDYATSNFHFKDPKQYHPYCPVDYSNSTSEQQCWMGDEKVALVDINTENPSVIDFYESWIGPFVQEYGIDGLRIDAAKHVRADFWPGFCGASGVFCIGEVFGDDIPFAASYQGPLDSVLNFPAYSAMQQAFGIPGQNMSALVDIFAQSKSAFKDLGLLGNFLENHDLPRWSNFSVDPQSMWNAMVYSWMTDGIPIVYYGQEQAFVGIHDPANREALWQSNYANTSTVQLVTKLNRIRDLLIDESDWLTSPADIISSTDTDVVVAKGFVISILTNIGSPAGTNANVVNSGYPTNTNLVEVLSCTQMIVGSEGSINVDYSKGGRPSIFIPTVYLADKGICSEQVARQLDTKSFQAAKKTSAAISIQASTYSTLALLSSVFMVLASATLWV